MRIIYSGLTAMLAVMAISRFLLMAAPQQWRWLGKRTRLTGPPLPCTHTISGSRAAAKQSSALTLLPLAGRKVEKKVWCMSDADVYDAVLFWHESTTDEDMTILRVGYPFHHKLNITCLSDLCCQHFSWIFFFREWARRVRMAEGKVEDKRFLARPCRATLSDRPLNPTLKRPPSKKSHNPRSNITAGSFAIAEQ